MKKRLFIGCSSEEIETAKIVKELLDNDFDVSIWNENIWDKSVFKLNNNFLNDLLKATLKFDFGILIGSPDDKLVKREKEVLTARDNIWFELGLFIGRLGMDKCAFLVDKAVEIPTDLDGIYLSKYTKENLAEKVNAIKDLFRNSNSNKLNFFPSTTLAYGYFENYIKPISIEYFKENSFTVDNKTYQDCKFRIIIPEKLSEDINLQYQKIKQKIGTEEKQVKSIGRTRNFNIDVKSFENGSLEILDFPTTLTGINYAIRELLPEEYKTYGDEYENILSREISRFEATLNDLIKKHDFGDFAFIEKSI